MAEPRFSILRSFKLGSFHIGSSLTDLLTSAIWNRIMVVDLGMAAWPVALLSALRYFLAPLTLWAGHRSDTRPILGSHRLAYIWLGRSLMLLSLPLLPLATIQLASGRDLALGWGLALVAFGVYGVGTLLSGAAFLALVHDSAPYSRRGQAFSIVQFMLVVSFAFIPAIYARVMPTYDPAFFWRLVITGMLAAALFWLVSVWGEERPRVDALPSRATLSFRASLGMIWNDRHARQYALFLGGSAFFAFMQDAVLEPFGGDVFGLSVGETTRFNMFWGIGVLLGMVGTFLLTRRRRPDQQVGPTTIGLAVLGGTLLLLGLSSLMKELSTVRPVLVLFGFGLGVFTVGGANLLMAMSKDERAGSYMALWSMVQLLGRGAGIAAGGILRDVALLASGEVAVAYGTVFLLEALGVVACVLLLRRVDVAGFARQRTARDTAELMGVIAE